MKIQINNLVKTYAGDVVLNDLSIEIVRGSKSAIVGENGSGKTTLLRILAGEEEYQEGRVFIPKEMSVGYMMQTYPDYDRSCREFILSRFHDYNHYASKLRELEAQLNLGGDMEQILAVYSKTFDKFEQAGGYQLENALDSYAKGLDVFDVLEQSFNTLSGGQKTRIALVQLLLLDYEVLCLDEPTNHLDIKGIEWLESFCQTTSKTLVIVSHDRQFLSNIVSVFHKIEDGQVVSYHGDYSSYRRQRHERYLAMVSDFEQQQKEIQRLKLSIRRYRQWGHESDNEDFYKRAKALEKRLERIEKLPKPLEIRNKLVFNLQLSQLGSKEVVIARDLIIGYDAPLCEPLSFSIKRGDRFAIVAANGKGKTTLLKTLLKEIDPLDGDIKFGESIEVGYLPQLISYENEHERILSYMRRICGRDEEFTRRSLARFGFYQGDMYKSLSSFSGGEQVRLKLLEIIIKGCNCLILDEPTNHLDINSCEIIEEVLSKFKGTILVISHDRMFLNKLNTQIFYLK